MVEDDHPTSPSVLLVHFNALGIIYPLNLRIITEVGNSRFVLDELESGNIEIVLRLFTSNIFYLHLLWKKSEVCGSLPCPGVFTNGEIRFGAVQW